MTDRDMTVLSIAVYGLRLDIRAACAFLKQGNADAVNTLLVAMKEHLIMLEQHFQSDQLKEEDLTPGVEDQIAMYAKNHSGKIDFNDPSIAEDIAREYAISVNLVKICLGSMERAGLFA